MNYGPSALPTAIGLAVIVLLVITRTRAQRVSAARLLILPTIVLVVGVATALPSIAGAMPRPVDMVIIAVDAVLSLGLGFARGRSVLVDARDGAIWYRYGTTTVVLWAVSIVARFALGAVGAHVGGNELVTSASVLFMLGISLITQNVLVLGRASACDTAR